MSENEKKDILNAELDESQLDEAAGGGIVNNYKKKRDKCGTTQQANCIGTYKRSTFENGCACTVEDGSWCDRNDACIGDAVVYEKKVDFFGPDLMA